MTDLDLTDQPTRVPPVVVKWAPYVASLVLGAAVVFYLVHRWQTVNKPAAAPAVTTTSKPATPPKAPVLDAAGRQVAGRFILTAVRRKDLQEAWTLASPSMRQGITHAEWLKGNLPVVPFAAPIGSAPLHIVSVDSHSALLEVALFPPAGSKVHPVDFFLALVKVGNQWKADSWVPRAAPGVRLRTAG